MSVELVHEANEFFIIEGTPGHYVLFRCRLEHVSSSPRKYELRELARNGTNR